MSNQDKPEIKRWTAKRRQALVLSIIRGETTIVEAARQHGLTVKEVEEWHEKALLGMQNSLRSRPHSEEALLEAENKRLKRKVGELVMDFDIYKEGMRGHPFGRKVLNELDES